MAKRPPPDDVPRPLIFLTTIIALAGCAPKPFQLAPLAPAHISYICTPTLFFDYDSFTLTQQHRKNLLGYLNSSQGCWAPVRSSPAYSIIVRGHSDSAGSAEENMTVSLRWAEAVREFLVAQGMDRDRIQTVGYGDTMPLMKTTGREPQNRRVVLSLALNGQEQHYF